MLQLMTYATRDLNSKTKKAMYFQLGLSIFKSRKITKIPSNTQSLCSRLQLVVLNAFHVEARNIKISNMSWMEISIVFISTMKIKINLMESSYIATCYSKKNKFFQCISLNLNLMIKRNRSSSILNVKTARTTKLMCIATTMKHISATNAI